MATSHQWQRRTEACQVHYGLTTMDSYLGYKSNQRPR